MNWYTSIHHFFVKLVRRGDFSKDFYSHWNPVRCCRHSKFQYLPKQAALEEKADKSMHTKVSMRDSYGDVDKTKQNLKVPRDTDLFKKPN